MTPATTRTVARALAATVGVQSVVTMATLTVPVFAPVAAADIGVDPNHVGLYASMVFIGAMTSSLMSGRFALRYGAIRVSQVCLLLAAIGIAVTTGATIVALLASAIALGLSTGPVTPASSHLLARHTPAHLRSLVFSIKQTAVPLGGVFAGVLVPLLVLEFGWRGAAWSVAAICLALIVLVQPTRRSFDIDLRPRERLFQGSVVGPLLLVLRDPGLRGPVLASAAYAGTQQTFSVFLVTYLVGVMDKSLIEAGLILSLAQAAGVAGRILWGGVADLVGNSRLVLAGLGFASAACALATASFGPGWSLAAIIGVCIAFGATAIGWNGVYLAEIARLVPDDQVGRATGGALFVTFFGVVAAPPAFGVLVTLTGSYAPGFVVLAALSAFSGAMLLRSARRPPAG